MDVHKGFTIENGKNLSSLHMHHYLPVYLEY